MTVAGGIEGKLLGILRHYNALSLKHTEFSPNPTPRQQGLTGWPFSITPSSAIWRYSLTLSSYLKAVPTHACVWVLPISTARANDFHSRPDKTVGEPKVGGMQEAPRGGEWISVPCGPWSPPSYFPLPDLQLFLSLFSFQKPLQFLLGSLSHLITLLFSTPIGMPHPTNI